MEWCQLSGMLSHVHSIGIQQFSIRLQVGITQTPTFRLSARLSLLLPLTSSVCLCMYTNIHHILAQLKHGSCSQDAPFVFLPVTSASITQIIVSIDIMVITTVMAIHSSVPGSFLHILHKVMKRTLGAFSLQDKFLPGSGAVRCYHGCCGFSLGLRAPPPCCVSTPQFLSVAGYTHCLVWVSGYGSLLYLSQGHSVCLVWNWVSGRSLGHTADSYAQVGQLVDGVGPAWKGHAAQLGYFLFMTFEALSHSSP